MLVEPKPIPDTFVTGLFSVEEVGGACLRFTFFADQVSTLVGEMDQVVVARLVLPVEAVESAAIVALGKVRETITHHQMTRKKAAH